jgi:hypothetical protein
VCVVCRCRRITVSCSLWVESLRTQIIIRSGEDEDENRNPLEQLVEDPRTFTQLNFERAFGRAYGPACHRCLHGLGCSDHARVIASQSSSLHAFLIRGTSLKVPVEELVLRIENASEEELFLKDQTQRTGLDWILTSWPHSHAIAALKVYAQRAPASLAALDGRVVEEYFKARECDLSWEILEFFLKWNPLAYVTGTLSCPSAEWRRSMLAKVSAKLFVDIGPWHLMMDLENAKLVYSVLGADAFRGISPDNRTWLAALSCLNHFVPHQSSEALKFACEILSVEELTAQLCVGDTVHSFARHGFDLISPLFPALRTRPELLLRADQHCYHSSLCDSGSTPLHVACEKGDSRVIQEFIVICPASVDALDGSHLQPFHIACGWPVPNFDILRLLCPLCIVSPHVALERFLSHTNAATEKVEEFMRILPSANTAAAGLSAITWGTLLRHDADRTLQLLMRFEAPFVHFPSVRLCYSLRLSDRIRCLDGLTLEPTEKYNNAFLLPDMADTRLESPLIVFTPMTDFIFGACKAVGELPQRELGHDYYTPGLNWGFSTKGGSVKELEPWKRGMCESVFSGRILNSDIQLRLNQGPFVTVATIPRSVRHVIITLGLWGPARLGAAVWTPSTHTSLPKVFRLQVKTLLLNLQRLRIRMPKDVLHLIIKRLWMNHVFFVQ